MIAAALMLCQDATVMCYGSTGAGKTHTMLGSDAVPGLVPLAIDAIFEQIAGGSMSYALQLSAIELVEERCVDLLHSRAPVVLRAGGGAASRSGGGGLVFSGLREVAVSTKTQLIERIAEAMAGRTVGTNYRHNASSRSHLVLRLRIDGARLVSLPAAAAPPAAPEPGDDGSGTVLAAGLGSSVSLRDATSATLTLIDLAGSEAATQNAGHVAVSQGLTINKSLHWLKVAVHELAAKRSPSTLRNSALTRLLAPALSGGAHVALIVCSSARPAAAATRDALEALAFGEMAARVALKPTRRTEVNDGQLGRLQALLVQMADDRAALATDAAALREQCESYEEMIGQMRSGFVSRSAPSLNPGTLL